MVANKLDLRGRGGVYIRVSGDKQSDASQRNLLQKVLEEHGVALPQNRWYVDEGSRDLADKRADFQRLLRDVQGREVDWILVDRQDRFGTADPYEFISYIHTFRKSRCRLQDVDGVNYCDGEIGTFIKGGLNAKQSEIEQQDKGARVIRGKIDKALKGQWQGGLPPYGMDVVCFDLTGTVERWRVVFEERKRGKPVTLANGRIVRPWDVAKVQVYTDGSVRRYDGIRRMPARERRQEILQLRPSSSDRLKIVRQVFKWFLTEATNPNQIAMRLEAQGIPPVNSPRWDDAAVRNILTNPIYTGKQRYNRQNHARFAEWVNGTRQQVDKNKPRYKYRADSDLVFSDQLFDPIVDVETFESVKDKLSSVPTTTRSPRSSNLWLAGMIFCQCGNLMRGHMMPSGKSVVPVYICGGYASKLPGCKCRRNSIRHDTVVEYISQFLDDTGDAMTEKGPVPGHVREAFAVFAERGIQLRKATEDLAGHNAGKGDLDDVVTRYRKAFSSAEPELQKELDQLKEEQRFARRSLGRLPDGATAAVEDLQLEILELDRQIKSISTRLVDAEAEFFAAFSALKQLWDDYAQARKGISNDSNERVKCAAIQRVIKRINVAFEETGKAYRGTIWKEIEVVPADYPNDTALKRSGNCLRRNHPGG